MLSGISVRLSGNENDTIFLGLISPPKTELPNVSIDSGNAEMVIEPHLSKALFPRCLTVDGNSANSKLEQPLKASSSMVSRPSGRFMRCMLL